MNKEIISNAIGAAKKKRDSDSLFWKYLFATKDTILKCLKSIKYSLKKISYSYLKILIPKPTLQYVEIHLTDHCNLNCKGCTHFSPFAEKIFLDIENYSMDLERLSQLFKNIKIIKLMGGEPLLHRKINDAISITRFWFPRAYIQVVTNGILLEKMPKEFWAACKNNKVILNITPYKIQINLKSIRTTAKEYGIRINTSCKIEKFLALHNTKGDSNPVLAMKYCRLHWYCPFLNNGMLYPCRFPALSHYFNKKFSTSLPAKEGINIYDDVAGWEILQALDKPISHCSYCATKYRQFEWGISQNDINEWIT